MEIFEHDILALLHLVDPTQLLREGVHHGLGVVLFEPRDLLLELLVAGLDAAVYSRDLIVHLLFELGQLLLDFVDQGFVLHCDRDRALGAFPERFLLASLARVEPGVHRNGISPAAGIRPSQQSALHRPSLAAALLLGARELAVGAGLAAVAPVDRWRSISKFGSRLLLRILVPAGGHRVAPGRRFHGL